MSTTVTRINNAIATHSKWKSTLKSAADSKQSAFTPADAALDARCELGRWLHGECAKLTTAEKGADFAKVRDLHVEFHKAAAAALAAALRGDRTVYEKEVAAVGTFSKASGALVNALVAWRTRLGG
jgi:hypothetical protein